MVSRTWPRITEQDSLREGTYNPRNSWRAFVFVFPFLRPYLRKVILVSLLDIVLTFLFLIPPWYAKFLVDEAFPGRNWSLATTLIALMIGTALITQLVRGTREYIYGYVATRLPLDMRNAMYGHLQRLSMETLDARPVGQYQYRIGVDADRVSDTLVRLVPTLNMVVEFAIILAFSTYADPLITGFVLLFLVPWAVLFWWVTNIGRVLDRRRLHCAELRDAGMLQGLTAMGFLKSAGLERFEFRKFTTRAAATQRVANTGYLILIPFEFVTQRLLPYLRQTLVFLYFARKVVLGEMTLGMTVPLIAYLNRINYPLERIINFWNWIRQTMISAERMMQILEVKPAIVSPSTPMPLPSDPRIELQGVRLVRGGRTILDDVSLTLEPESVTAIVGPSGAGKSTLGSLLLRLADPDAGRVMLGGIDLREFEMNRYLREVAVVLQETFVFAGSMAENLKFAYGDATEANMWHALEEVDLADWVRELPGGLDEDLQGGAAMSEGQKQRLGLARALLAQPRWLVLDEPTSALDAQTEAKVMETIERIAQGRTTLLITHRLDTVRGADRIIVLESGKVVEQGTYEELIKMDGLFANMRRDYSTHGGKSGKA